MLSFNLGDQESHCNQIALKFAHRVTISKLKVERRSSSPVKIDLPFFEKKQDGINPFYSRKMEVFNEGQNESLLNLKQKFKQDI